MGGWKEQYKSQQRGILPELKVHNIGKEACAPCHQWTGAREFYSFHMVVDGEGVFQVDEQLFTLGKGDIFLVKPNTLVSYQADAKNPWSYLWIGLSGTNVENILENCLFPVERPYIKAKEPEKLEKCLWTIFENKGNDLASEVAMIGGAYIFLSYLMDPDAIQKKQNGNQYAQRAQEWMDLHYASGISSNQVAEELHISRSHLHRVFVRQYHCSVGDYIQKLRMKRACFLLKSTNFSIGEISNSVGFENQFYFSNAFKKYHGCSPTDYRRGTATKENKSP